MARRLTRPPAFAAFTLVELLVAVAIIALLLAMLLPALGGARRQAQAAVCGSNLHQLAIASAGYVAEHGGTHAPGAADFVAANRNRWHGTRSHASQPFQPRGGPLTPYLTEETGVRRCPSFAVALPETDPRRFERNCGGYGYNLAFVGRRLARTAAGGWRVETDRAGVQAARVRRPAETVLFADAAFVSDVPIEYSFLEPRYEPTFGNRPDPSLHFRHQHLSNVLWTDGHVERRKRTFSWHSGLYAGDPAAFEVGWFGDEDDNSWFDLE